jgi:hypothetical protein
LLIFTCWPSLGVKASGERFPTRDPRAGRRPASLRGTGLPLSRSGVSPRGFGFGPGVYSGSGRRGAKVFLKVHHAIESFRGEAEFSSWIYRTTFNQAVNLKARVRFRRPHADETVLDQAVSPGPGPYRQAETAQRDRALAECIQALPEVTSRPYGCTIGWARAEVKWRS